jgi:alpha-L-fucosidase
LTINRSWGYNAGDDQYKSPEQLVQALAGAAGRGANLLLNIGPRPDGSISPEFTERLMTVGRWLEGNGQAVYGTRKGPIPPQAWGVTTARTGRNGGAPAVYLHLFKPDVTSIVLPEELVEYDAIPLGKTEPLKRQPEDRKAVLEVPAEGRAPYDAIIVLSPPALGR